MTSQLFVSGHNLAPYAFQKPRLGRMDEKTPLYTCFVPWRPPEPVNVSQNTCLVAHSHQAFSPTMCRRDSGGLRWRGFNCFRTRFPMEIL